ncbi:MAG: MBL fold metallo-hydrolase [Solirubrobacterales bacterium]
MADSPLPNLIDTLHRGRARAIGCWDLGGLLVDPGPEPCMHTVLSAVSEPPRALLLTHIHLDHAGAAGALARHFPELTVYVHRNGAEHLADPSKLIASATRLYGDEMQELWGEIVPVPAERIVALEGGESIEVAGRALDVIYAPGHASHHVVYLDRRDGIAYVGDVAGVRIPPCDFVMAPTVPPELDLELWRESIELVRAKRPARLALTHFGAAEDVSAQLDGALAALQRQGEVARSLLESGLGSESAGERFAAELEKRIRAESDSETAATALQVSSPHVMWLGLERYWGKRAAESRT